MGVFEFLPYVNFHELNLDWLLKQTKENKENIEHLNNNIYDIMTEWLNDGTISTLVTDVLSNKVWFAEYLNGIDFTPAIGDLVITGGFNAANDNGSGVYIVDANDGLNVAGFYYKPIMAESSLSYGIIADGITDNRQQLQKAINWSNKIDFLSSDVLMLSGSVQLKDNLILNGNGCMICAGVNSLSSGSYMLYGTGLKNIKIYDITFNRQSSTNDFYALSLPNSENIEINGCEFINGTGYMCRLSGNKNLKVINCKAKAIVGIMSNPGGVFYIQGGEQLYFNNIYSTDIEDHVVYIDGSIETKQITVKNIIAHDFKIATALTAAAVVVLYGNAHDFIISGVMVNNVKTGISLNERGDMLPYNGIVTDNQIYNTTVNGIESIGKSTTIAENVNNIIQNNAVYNAGQDCLSVRYQKNVIVKGNYSEGAGRYGIDARAIDDSLFDNNIIHHCSQGLTGGGSGTPVTNSIISNNTAYDCSYGIRVSTAACTGNYFVNNTEVDITNPTTYPTGNYLSDVTFTPT